VRLRDYGIIGNGNLMLMEKNNHEVFGVIRQWLDKKLPGALKGWRFANGMPCAAGNARLAIPILRG
jgi:hypothetical protein